MGMCAFSDSHTSMITGLVDMMAMQTLRTLPPCPTYTYEDVFDMFGTRQPLRDFLLRGRELVSVGENEAGDEQVTLPNDVRLSVIFHGKNKPLMPKKPSLDRNFFISDPRSVQLMKRAEGLLQLADDWGVVEHVWCQLNDRLTSPAQVRYVWPSILAIMGQAPNDDKYNSLRDMRNKILPLKVPRELPALSAELRALIRRASTVVTMYTLLGRAVEEPAKDGNVSLLFIVPYTTPKGYALKQLHA